MRLVNGAGSCARAPCYGRRRDAEMNAASICARAGVSGSFITRSGVGRSGGSGLGSSGGGGQGRWIQGLRMSEGWDGSRGPSNPHPQLVCYLGDEF